MADDDQVEYVVEAVRDWRYNLDTKCKEFLIKWKDYSEEENTWEPESNMNCFDILRKFKSTLDPESLSYLNSDHPENLDGFQRNAAFIRCLGAGSPHESDSEDSTKVDKQKFYVWLQFEDSDDCEEFTFHQFMKYKPEEAWDFLEQRLYIKKSYRKRKKVISDFEIDSE